MYIKENVNNDILSGFTMNEEGQFFSECSRTEEVVLVSEKEE